MALAVIGALFVVVVALGVWCGKDSRDGQDWRPQHPVGGPLMSSRRHRTATKVVPTQPLASTLTVVKPAASNRGSNCSAGIGL